MPANLIADGLQPRVGDDAHVRVDRGLQLLEGVDHALQRAVVVNPRHLEAFSVFALELLVHTVQALVDQRPALFHREGGGRGRLRRCGRRLRCVRGGARRVLSDLGGQSDAEQALILFVAPRGARLIGNGVGPILASSDASADAVAALGALTGTGDLALERTTSSFALGTDALTLGLFGLAVRFTFGVFGFLLFVFQPFGLVASGVAFGDLL